MPPRRYCKIARFPDAVRRRLNVMLLDGVPYADIIKNLGHKGAALTKQDMSRWFKGGYKDWLEENRHLERLKATHEFCKRLVKENEGSEVQEAALKLAAGHIFELLSEFDVKTLKETFEGNPEDYARIVRALFQISGGGLKHDEYRAKVAQIKAAIEREIKTIPEGGGLPLETLRAIEQQIGLL
jgi:hypothetical protein